MPSDLPSSSRARSVRVPDELWEAVREIAHSRGETVTSVIVGALRRYVTSNGWDVSPVDALDHIARLRREGVLSAEEFTTKKAELLGRL